MAAVDADFAPAAAALDWLIATLAPFGDETCKALRAYRVNQIAKACLQNRRVASRISI
jgi:hypothetical protein